MNKAHVFQHNTTGVQIFVWHCSTEEQAKSKFTSVVINSKDWEFLGYKTVSTI